MHISKKAAILGGILMLALAAFLAGGIVLTTAHASNATAASKPGSGSVWKTTIKVSSLQGNRITGLDSRTGKTLIVITNANTRFFRDDTVESINISAIHVGMQLGVYGQLNNDGSLTAEGVALLMPAYYGQVSAINGNTITLKGLKDASVHTVHVNAQTRYVRDAKNGQTGHLSEIHVGMQLEASGTLNSDGSLNASLVTIRTNVSDAQQLTQGKITSISGTTITATDEHAHLITIHVNSNTQYVNKNSKQETFSLANLKVGDQILFAGTTNHDGSVTAKFVMKGPVANSSTPNGKSVNKPLPGK